jgi:hypothetical protein
VPVNDPSAIEVVRGKFHPYAIARKDPNPEPPHLAGDVTEYDPVHVVELHAKHRVGQCLDDLALELNFFFLWHQLAILFQKPPPPLAGGGAGGVGVDGVVAVLAGIPCWLEGAVIADEGVVIAD